MNEEFSGSEASVTEPNDTVCPKCRFPRTEGALECPACGVVYAKVQARQPEVAPSVPPETRENNPYEAPKAPVVVAAVPPPVRFASSDESFVPLDRRASWALALFGLSVLLDVVMLAADVSQLRLISRGLSGEGFTEAEAAANDGRMSLISTANLVVYAGCVLTFLVWFRRAYANLLGLGAEKLEHSPGWAIGFFFVPLANLVYPYRIAKEIWHGSQSSSDAGEPLLGGVERGQSLVTSWWLSWLLAGFIGNVALGLSRGNTLAALQGSTKVSMLSTSLSAVAGILAIVMIRTVSRLQNEKHAVRDLP